MSQNMSNLQNMLYCTCYCVITSIYTYGQQKHTNFKVLLGGNFSLFKSFLQCAQYKNCKTEYRNIVTVAGRVLFPFYKFGIPCDQF